MAREEANLIIRLIDNASKGVKSIGDRILKLKDSYISAAAVIAATGAVVLDSVKAFAEQEEAVRKLDRALMNQGIASKSASKDIQDFASELERTSRFSDEAIISGQAMLVTFGLTGEKLKQATRASIDLASGLGVDLRTAMMLVGKASQGNVETLGRFGIKLKDGIPEAGKFAAALGEINRRFGGAAQSDAQSFSGSIDRLRNLVNNLQEELGKALAPSISSVVSAMSTGVQFATRYKDSISGMARAVAFGLDPIRRMRDAIRDMTGASGAERLARGNRDMAQAIKDVAKAEDNRAAAQKASSEAASQAAEKEKADFIAVQRAKVESFGLSQEEIALIQAEKDAEKLTKMEEVQVAEDRIGQARKALEDSRRKETEDKERARNAAMVSSTQTALSGILALNVKHSKELVALQKAAGVAQVIINTAQAVMGVWKWASGMGPFGFALGAKLSALMVATGAAQIASIAGAQLAEGGLVMPRSGGTLATIGEGGRPEAVIPLGDARAKEQIADALGGSAGLTVNINAGVMTGDRYQAQQLAEMIDQELYRLSRNRKSLGDYIG